MASVYEDPRCICRGNWRDIVKEAEPLLDKKLVRDGKAWRFFGVVHGSDDYYYGLSNADGEFLLLSCVANLENWGFVPVQT